MNLFNLIKSLNLNNIFLFSIILIIIYALRMFVGIKGISYGVTIIDTPNNISLNDRKKYEYLVGIICIIWSLGKTLIFRSFIPLIIYIPLISYLIIKEKYRKAKGILFIILNITLLLI